MGTKMTTCGDSHKAFNVQDVIAVALNPDVTTPVVPLEIMDRAFSGDTLPETDKEELRRLDRLGLTEQQKTVVLQLSALVILLAEAHQSNSALGSLDQSQAHQPTLFEAY